MKTEEQIQRIEEENLKLKYLLRAARAEIKKREGELAPLNFKLGEMQSYIDELEHLEKKVKMYENGNLKTPAEVKVKEKMKNVSRMYEKASIESSFYKKRLYETGFSHIFWDNGSGGQRDSVYSWFWTPALYKIMDVVKNNFIIRSRGDMTMYTHKLFEHDPHVDFSFPHISTVYYVNNSDGDTIFFNKKLKEIKKRDPFIYK